MTAIPLLNYFHTNRIIIEQMHLINAHTQKRRITTMFLVSE